MSRPPLFAGFRDPVRRPRLVVWTGVAVLAMVAVVIAAVAATSTNGFCAQSCHQVMDDSVAAYDASPHARVSCVACHIPVNADPATFLFHKAEAGIVGGYQVLTRTYELPLNADSEIAMDAAVMPSRQCTQCHSANRIVSPSPGIIINHKVHEEKGVTCTVCHNRTAHRDSAIKITLKGDRPHEDFMRMVGCFRCHGLASDAKAPGACSACHPPGFNLKPLNHSEQGFYRKFGDSAGHAALALADAKSMKAGGKASGSCDMCHVRAQFCDGCHGVSMPHPAGFTKTHGSVGKKSPVVCANCHAKGQKTAAGTEFCNGCHHKGSDPKRPWLAQHGEVAKATGDTPCFTCHTPTFCPECHVRAIAK